MKKFITEKDLSKVISNRLGLDYEANNAKELNEFINEITPSLNAKWAYDEKRVLTASEYWESYDASSPNCVVDVLLNKYFANKFISEYYDYDDCMYTDEQEEDCYYSIDEVPTEKLFVGIPTENIEQELSKCKAFSKKYSCQFIVKISNYYSLAEEINREPIELAFDNGELSGEGIIYFPLDNEEILVSDARWLTNITKSIEELEQFGIYAMFSGEDTGSQMKLDDNYLTKAIIAKYSNQNIAKSIDEAIELVKVAPVTINYIDNKYITKDVIFAFLTSNQKYIDLYNQNYINGDNEKRAIYRDELLNGVHPEYEYKLKVNLSNYLDDEAILKAIVKSNIDIEFIESTYNEGLISKLLNEKYNLIYPLFDYWLKQIDADKKTDTKIRTKYNLMLSDSKEIVVFCKCYDIISNVKIDKSIYIANLVYYSCEYFEKMDEENADKYISIILNLLDKNIQRYVASKYLMLVKYMKPENIDEDLAQYVIKNCQCAGNLLPDEYVLKYKRKVEDIDINETCEKCKFCMLRLMI